MAVTYCDQLKKSAMIKRIILCPDGMRLISVLVFLETEARI